jgi:hypothetical protein
MRYPASEKLEIIRLVEESAKIGVPHAPSIVGAICTRPVVRKPWKTNSPNRIASGTAFRLMFASASSGWRWMSRRCRREN